MNIWFSKYHIEFNTKPIEGALLKFCFSPGLVGYSCLQPWEDLGDVSLDRQLINLKNADINTILKQCFYFAQIDAQARRDKINLSQNFKLPPAHYLVSSTENLNTDLIKNISTQGYELIKLKVTQNFTSSALQISQLAKDFKRFNIKLRLDFNSKFTLAEAENFFNQIKKEVGNLDFIDLIEDPCVGNDGAWLKLQDKFNIVLAADREISGRNDAKVIVIKPAIQNTDEMVSLAQSSGKKVFFTSNLEHAFGAGCAAYETSRIYNLYPQMVLPCGLLKSDLLMAKEGFGFGFDIEFEKREWGFLV